MKIKTNFDVVNSEPPSADKGTLPWDNPGIDPYEKAIPETPGEKAVNSTEPDMINKGPTIKRGDGNDYCE